MLSVSNLLCLLWQLEGVLHNLVMYLFMQVEDQLADINEYLRTVHHYCVWCGCAFNGEMGSCSPHTHSLICYEGITSLLRESNVFKSEEVP